MKTAKILSVLLSVILILSSLPLSVSAAQVVEIDGERTAFISSFGKLVYNGKSYASYKTFDEALNALGDRGGRIVISGGLRIEKFNDISGRQKLTIVGVGANAMGNLIDFSGNPEVALGGDLALGNVNIKTDENACIITNGYDFSTFENFDTYHTIKYVESGDHIVTYLNPPSVAVGNATGNTAFNLTAGKYNTIIAGAADGYRVTADTLARIEGGEVSIAVAGNTGNGVTDGNSKLVVDGGSVSKVVAGSEGGTFNGNITTEINGGKIDELVIGAASGAKVDGNVILAVNGGEISKFSAFDGKISGNKIVITPPDVDIELPSGFADYIITIDGGFAEPVFDDKALSGFLITDKFGIPAKEITLNGSKTLSETAVYKLKNGKNTISVPAVITLALNKNADYVAGYEDGSFRPQNNMTKAEAVTLLTRLLVDENYIKGHIKSDFTDVEDGAWYESYIGLFEKLGYLKMLSLDYGLKFAPNELITRGEFTQLIYEISSFATDAASLKLKSFSDVANNNVFAPAVNFAVSNGIVSGYEDGTFRPANNITRAEVVTMVNRMLGRNPNGNAGENNFNDISGHWAQGQILAACNDENVSWTQNNASSAKYVLTGTTTKDYVVGLYEQSATLSADAIREGVDIISEQVKQNILNAPDTIDTTGKKVYYISEKNGNDENNGLTPETAFKTIAALSKARLLRNAVVLFERGGIYRGQLFVSNNMSYGA
ncbi:MAG: S-layer homology domain-containing protein, partial [Clostridia bacterium]|nr:S-layer homology domain-containing protein [Clostridia bacterium]